MIKNDHRVAEIPPIKKSLVGQGTVQKRNPSYMYTLYNSDPNCAHEWIVTKWSGVECNDCPGWYCA